MKGTTRKLTVAAMLSAVAFILMFIEFSVPFMPSFVKLDVSDLPALLGTFALGPVYGVVIELLKNLLHILIKGTSSAGVGELFNFLNGAAFSVTAGLVYLRNKTKKGAIIGAGVGALVMALVSLPLNYFLVYPAYEVAYGMPMAAIIGAYQAILPSVDGLLQCLLIFNLPFTLMKGILVAALCMLIYKPLSPVLHGTT